MVRNLGPLTRLQVIERAHRAIGQHIVYRLGAGGRDPFAQSPARSEDNGCDCTGLVAWVFGVDRYLPNGLIPHLPGGDWLETSNVYEDAISQFGFVTQIADVKPADVLVWPDRDGHQGHIGIVAALNGSGTVDRVIHCSLGNWNTYHDAVHETDAEIFTRHGAVAARIRWVRD